MVKAAEDRWIDDAAVTVSFPWSFGSFELERAVGPRRVVVLDVLDQHVPKVALVQQDDVVRAFPT